MIRPEQRDSMRGTYAPDDHLGPVAWAEQAIDYARTPAYDTEYKSRYRGDYMPYWQEPAEAYLDRTVREIVILKASRVGCSENVFFTPMRWMVARRPMSCLYLNADQQSTEDILERRIRRGFGLSAETARAYRGANVRQHEIIFPDCDIVARWPRCKSAFKSSGYPVIMADEFSTWPEFGWDMLVGRAANYAFAHIFAISSPDPASKRRSCDDPIFREYELGDKRKWTMRDPAGGEGFVLSMEGLKWEPRAKGADGEWDLQRVADSAHYVTPGGATFGEDKRGWHISRGVWIPTATGAPGRRSYHAPAFLSPLENGRFGKIAVEFLKAKRAGRQHLRTFLYEYAAEPFPDETDRVPASRIEVCELPYTKGTHPGATVNVWIPKPKVVIVTSDVQKTYWPCVAREWIDGGDSGLIDWTFAPDVEALEAFAVQHKAAWVAIDYGYAARAMEVFEYALQFRAIPLKGSDNVSVPLKHTLLDPYEGKARQGMTQLETWTYHTDVFKGWLLDLQRGEAPQKWHVYKGIEREYVRQVTSEERGSDGKWVLKQGQSQNHLWDCEVMQLVLASAKQIVQYGAPKAAEPKSEGWAAGNKGGWEVRK